MLAADVSPLECPGVRRTFQQLLETEGKEAAQRYLQVVTTGLQQIPDPPRPRHKRKQRQKLPKARRTAKSRPAQSHAAPVKSWIDPNIKGTWIPPQKQQEIEGEDITLIHPIKEGKAMSQSNGKAVVIENPSSQTFSRSHHMKELAQSRTHKAKERAETALKELEAQEGPVTQKAFLQLSGLSSSWLHNHPEFQKRLTNLKNQRKEQYPSWKAAAQPGEDAQQTESGTKGRPLNSATFEQHLRQKRQEVALKLAELQPQVRYLEGQLAGIDEVFELLGVSK